MSRPFRWGRAIALVCLLAFVTLALLVAGIGSALPLEHTTFVIDGRAFDVSGMNEDDAAIVVLAIAAALMVALVSGAMALVFTLVAGALAICAAVIVVLAVLALAASPLLLLVWAVWRLAQPPRRADTPPPAAFARS